MTIFRHAFLLLLILPNLYGQRLPVQTYTSKDGLASNFITEIFQDSKGYLWIGTDEGISIFDGDRFKNIRFDENTIWGYVNDIIELPSSHEEYWIATNGGGLIRMLDGSVTSFSLGPDPRSNSINSLIDLGNGELGCATDDGIYIYDRNVGSSTKVPKQERTKYSKFTRSLDGTIWCFDEMNLFTFAPTTRTLTRPEIPGLPTDSIIHVSSLTDSSIAVHVQGPKNGRVIIVKDSVVTRTYELFSQVGFFTVKGPHARYWTGTPEGLHMVQEIGGEPFKWIYSTTNGLPVNELTIGFQDRDQNIWFGSFGRGLTKLENQQSSQFIFPGMSGKGSIDPFEHLWIPSTHGIYELWRDSSSQWKRHLHVVRDNDQMLSLVASDLDRTGRLWVTSDNGSLYSFTMERKNGERSTLTMKDRLTEKDGYPRALTISLLVDSHNVLWYSLHNGGIVGVDCSGPPKIVAQFIYGENTILRDVRALYEDRSGNIWAMGFDPDNRIIRRKEGRIILDSTDAVLTSLPKIPFRSVLQTADGTWWFGSRHNGLFYYREGKLSQMTTADGMISNQIWSLTETPNGGLLIGTQGGLMHMPDRSIKTFSSLQQYTQSPVTTIASTPAFSFALTRFELTIFSIPGDSMMLHSPDVQFTSLFVNGNHRKLTPQIELTSGENTVTVEYTAILFNNTGALRFQYRLEPLEEEWRPATTGRSVTYANLDPGNYRFAVRTLNRQGEPSDRPSYLSVSIASPIWMRWWFISLVIAGFIGILAAAERIRVRRLLEIEKIRSRIAADLHDDIGSGLTRIALLSDMIHRQSITEKVQTDPQFTVPSLTEKVGAISRELVDAMSDVVWSIDPKNSSMERLLQRVRTFAVEVCEAKEIELDFIVSPGMERQKVGSDSIRAVLLVAKEALTNVVRHSNARKVIVTLRTVKQEMVFEISDDGKGFDINELSRMNGLTNMRLRIEKNGGSFSLDSAKGRGTFVYATMPLHK
jgi:signal transduction histidine kinase/ligand-binding sensor domain-containing protein